MTTTSFTSADVKTRKAWSLRVYKDIVTDTEVVADMVKNGILKVEDDLVKGRGDNVKVHFVNRLQAKGFIDDEAIGGNESAMTYYQSQVDIHEFNAVISIPNAGTISQQRVVFDLPEDTYQVLKMWLQEKTVVGILNNLCGNTATSITYDSVTYSTTTDLLKITMGNAPTAPSSNQIIYAGSGNTSDQNVGDDPTATFSLKLIDEAEARARKNRPYVNPLKRSDGIKYICYVHVDGFKQLIQDTSSPIQYRDIYLNKIASGKDDELFNASAMYSQTLIVATDKIPYGVTASAADANVRRALFVGQDAGSLAFGQGYKMPDGTSTAGFSFHEDMLEVERIKRIRVCGMMGANKNVFNSIDRGTIVISHYVA